MRAILSTVLFCFAVVISRTGLADNLNGLANEIDRIRVKHGVSAAAVIVVNSDEVLLEHYFGLELEGIGGDSHVVGFIFLGHFVEHVNGELQVVVGVDGGYERQVLAPPGVEALALFKDGDGLIVDFESQGQELIREARILAGQKQFDKAKHLLDRVYREFRPFEISDKARKVLFDVRKAAKQS